jgi:hypothetical protein
MYGHMCVPESSQDASARRRRTSTSRRRQKTHTPTPGPAPVTMTQPCLCSRGRRGTSAVTKWAVKPVARLLPLVGCPMRAVEESSWVVVRLCADRRSFRRLVSSVVGLWYEQPARALFLPGTCPWVDAPWLADGAAVGCGYWVRLGHGRLARSSALRPGVGLALISR